MVVPLNNNEYESRHPLKELIDMVGAKKVIVLESK